MSAHDTPAALSSSLTRTLFALLAAYRPVVRQERVFVRLVVLSIGSLLAMGRHTLSQLLLALGVADRDWTSWYRLFNRSRIDLPRLQATLLAQVVAELPATGPIVVGVDATQLPRTSRRMPGCGYTVQLRTPKWRRGIHLAQRFVGISALLPRSVTGESRAVPLRWLPLRTAKTTPIGTEPERTESQGVGELTAWLRDGLDQLGRTAQPLVVLGDGAHSNAGVLRALPAGSVLFARCAKNRALFALPRALRPRPAAALRRARAYADRDPAPPGRLAGRALLGARSCRHRDREGDGAVAGARRSRSSGALGRGPGRRSRARHDAATARSAVLPGLRDEDQPRQVGSPRAAPRTARVGLAALGSRGDASGTQEQFRGGRPASLERCRRGECGGVGGLGLCAAGAGRLPGVGLPSAAGTGSRRVVAPAALESGPSPAGDTG
jgi:hypothetical protein